MGKETYVLGMVGAVMVGAGCRDAFGCGLGHKTVYLATGQQGRGIPTSLTRLLVDPITGVKAEISVEPYLLSRTVQEYAHD